MAAQKRNLLLLFDRPSEPVFMAKGDSKTVFDVPDNFIPDKYRPIGPQLQSRFGEDAGVRVPVRNISIPDISVPMQLSRRDHFSLFLPRHRKIAARLIDIFVGMRNIDDLQSVAVYCRDRLNPYLFNYAMSVALLHREDTKDLPLPNFVESFPDKFMDSAVFSKAREEAGIVPEGSRVPIIIPKDYTASDLDEEHRVAYFREDIGINLHHWHWHLVYPFEATNRAIVDKDRRGELFYYMHEQIIARYNCERLSNRLGRVKRLINLREPIVEGYFPKMDSMVASRAWPPRFNNTSIKDLDREVDQIKADVSDLERWISRFYEAINQGFVVGRNNERIPLTEEGGIDILGNMMESSILSPNPALYGDLHNMGHVFISYSHDPDHRHLETYGVMGDSATAMRDPVFYRWHAFVDDVFQEYKGTLPRYDVARLNYQGITVTGISVSVQGEQQPNRLQTYWQQSDVDLSRGMDFAPRGNVFARFTHLQHAPFTYNIQVNNDSAARMGTVRIFIAPKVDERGLPMLFRDQRTLFIELDRFSTVLQQGQNTITRRSDQSSVTIPFERTFRDLTNRPAEGTDAEAAFNFCGCGWPQHMLIPKGTPEGMPYELFVMVSNHNQDRVDQDVSGTCNDSESYCGIRDRLYPDRRSMGYPFDRLPRDGVENLQQFLTPNMRVQDVTIMFTERTVVRGQ